MMLSVLQVDDDGNLESFTAMGFEVLQTFDEVSCDAGTFRSLT